MSSSSSASSNWQILSLQQASKAAALACVDREGGGVPSKRAPRRRGSGWATRGHLHCYHQHLDWSLFRQSGRTWHCGEETRVNAFSQHSCLFSLTKKKIQKIPQPGMKFPRVYSHLSEGLPNTSWFSNNWHNPSIHTCSNLISKCPTLRQVLRISKSGNGDAVVHHVMQNSQYSDRKANVREKRRLSDSVKSEMRNHECKIKPTVLIPRERDLIPNFGRCSDAERRTTRVWVPIWQTFFVIFFSYKP